MTKSTATLRARIAVVIPALNAALLLSECVAAVRAQSTPADEIWIVVGPSRDRTLAVAESLADVATTILQNPPGDRASAINLALDRSRADLFVMLDAQARLGPTYIATAVAALDRTKAAVVGGPMRAEGRSAVGRAMATALRSPFGVGDSQFHFVGAAREVESVYLGVFRASVFERVGRYNPALLRTEDDDMNARIRDVQLRIWLDPAIESTYLCRNRLSEIWTQYVGYGYWKVALATRRPNAIRLRHATPAAFVLLLVAVSAVSLAAWWPALPLVAALYAAIALAAGAAAGVREVLTLALFPIVTMSMHVGYGFGSLVGLARWTHLRRLVNEPEHTRHHGANG